MWVGGSVSIGAPLLTIGVKHLALEAHDGRPVWEVLWKLQGGNKTSTLVDRIGGAGDDAFPDVKVVFVNGSRKNSWWWVARYLLVLLHQPANRHFQSWSSVVITSTSK